MHSLNNIWLSNEQSAWEVFGLGLAVQLVCFQCTEQPVCHCEYPRDVLF